MEIAVLVFFIAIFGGFLFLIGLIWFIFRRVRNSRSGNRNFSSGSSGSSSSGGSQYNPQRHSTHTGDNDAFYAGNEMPLNQETENARMTETAHDAAVQSGIEHA